MKDRTTRFLLGSLIGVALLCVCVFCFLAVRISAQSSRTINEVGLLYMSSMSEQISMHFETTITLRLDQMTALVETEVFGDVHGDPARQGELSFNAQARGIGYLGFYREDGTFDMVYGEELKLDDPEPFRQSLTNGERKVAIGSDAGGNVAVLLGAPAAHDPGEENPCIGLVGALPVSYISDTLSLNEDNENLYSFIIREDGTFIIQSVDVERENYFDRVRALYEDVGGMSPEEYITQLRAAMAKNEEYSTEFTIYGERRHMFCTRLSDSEWYLLTFMPYGLVDSNVNALGREWGAMALIGGGIVLAALLLVFAQYFRLTQRQLRALEEARREAEEARKRAEDVRKEAEHANRAKSEFLSNMSHDIRTPMNAIVGMTAIAAANIGDRGQVENCLKKITLSSKHLLGLINDVLDMSKIESGKMVLTVDRVSLREVVESIVSICQPQVKSRRQRFDVSIHDISAENVLCDSVRLNQVLLNLLSNAIKFTPEGGRIQMALYQEDSPKGEGFVRTHIRVEDNGIGMSEEFQKRIFDSFAREDSQRVHRTEGTGLGMAITRFIVVDAMGGAINVKSRRGEGSEFHVTLDLERAGTAQEDMTLPNWNMLVVDDDRQLCEYTVSVLNGMGVSAEWTLDAESAVELVAKRHGRGDGYQVILLDWKLPGMDGVAAARRIREKLGGSVPILLISAYDWSEIEHDARQAGINGFISKPLFRSTLFNALRQYVGLPEREAEKPAERGRDLSGRHILVAEDNELNWEIASELLGEEGLLLDWAENGQQCVEMLQASPVGHYDAILMDVRMPIMGGYEATQVIRALDRADKDLPIIAMTADAFAEDVKRSMDCGMDAHVAKPIDVREVMRLLGKFIR